MLLAGHEHLTSGRCELSPGAETRSAFSPRLVIAVSGDSGEAKVPPTGGVSPRQGRIMGDYVNLPGPPGGPARARATRAGGSKRMVQTWEAGSLLRGPGTIETWPRAGTVGLHNRSFLQLPGWDSPHTARLSMAGASSAVPGPRPTHAPRPRAARWRLTSLGGDVDVGVQRRADHRTLARTALLRRLRSHRPREYTHPAVQEIRGGTLVAKML